jgi:capsule polysaccharide export protein KpsE/RkpR
VFALLLAVNDWYAGSLSSTVMNNTIKANDVYSFYQAKSVKQALAEQSLYDAVKSGDKARAADMTAKIDRYENEPKEGKKALMAHAKELEAARDEAKKRSPWIGYASTAYQMAIVLLSASILAVSMSLFWSSFLVAGVGLLLSSQGVLLWF